jgi:hypothetical protein
MYNIVSSAVKTVWVISRGRHLAGTRMGTHDKISPASRPVLVGVELLLHV